MRILTISAFILSLSCFAADECVRNSVVNTNTPANETNGEITPLPVWGYQAVWPQHNMLKMQLISCVRRGDIVMMENVCRRAVSIMPGDATWHYNLACALAYREKSQSALEELERAIRFGFRDADAIAKDQDLQQIKELPKFKELLALAKSLAKTPIEGRANPSHYYAAQGSVVTLSETNVVFNFETGIYEALIKFSAPEKKLAEVASTYSASNPKAPEKSLLVNWMTEGTAVGNADDVYINRDRYHSSLTVSDFPQLTALRYDEKAKEFKTDCNHPNTLVPGAAVFGNISRGYLNGPLWRSLARATYTDTGSLAAKMDALYKSNQFWVIPCVNDFGKPELGDVFPANAPFQFVSDGASWSDQPFLRAALAASASFQRITKQALLRRKLMGPTLQWLLRRTMRGIKSESDYLSSRAHPTAFNSKNLDVVNLVEKAHALKPENIPPAVNLSVINSRIFPVKFPRAGIDYPDTTGEVLFSTSSAIGFVLRGIEGERTFLFRATSYPENDPMAKYEWRVVHGDASAVKISTPLGESVNSPENGYAQITIDRRKITERIDVACFAKTEHTDYGAPSIISFYPVPLEKREYRADGKIASIDYSNPDNLYCDPVIALPRRWKDTYEYMKDGSPLGFTRSYNGKAAASFTPTGERIIEKNKDGTAKRVVRVMYTTRKTGNQFQPIELTYTDDGEPFDVK